MSSLTNKSKIIIGVAILATIIGLRVITLNYGHDDYSNVQLLNGIQFEPLTKAEQGIANGIGESPDTGININDLELAKKMANSKDRRKSNAGKRFIRNYNRMFGSFGQKSHKQQLEIIDHQEDLSDPSNLCGHSAGEVIDLNQGITYDHDANIITYKSGGQLVIGIDAATNKARVIEVITNGKKQYDDRITSKATQMLCVSLSGTQRIK